MEINHRDIYIRIWYVKEPPSMFLDLPDIKFIKYMYFDAVFNQQLYVTK